jgi:hypothetical protein
MLWLEINWNVRLHRTRVLNDPIASASGPGFTANHTLETTRFASSDVSSAVVWVETPGTEDEYAVAGDQLERVRGGWNLAEKYQTRPLLSIQR